jgi:hypothetical protein
MNSGCKGFVVESAVITSLCSSLSFFHIPFMPFWILLSFSFHFSLFLYLCFFISLFLFNIIPFFPASLVLFLSGSHFLFLFLHIFTFPFLLFLLSSSTYFFHSTFVSYFSFFLYFILCLSLLPSFLFQVPLSSHAESIESFCSHNNSIIS